MIGKVIELLNYFIILFNWVLQSEVGQILSIGALLYLRLGRPIRRLLRIRLIRIVLPLG